jgi:hypothetical protein
MKSLALALALVVGVAACGPRAVEVRSSPSGAAVNLRVTNNHTQAVNVTVVSAGNEIFGRQVAAGATETIPVAGVAVGTSVTLRATAVDGSRTWSKQNVVLTAMTPWQVP